MKREHLTHRIRVLRSWRAHLVAVGCLLTACTGSTPEPQLVPTRTLAPRPTPTVGVARASATATAEPLTGLTLEAVEQLAPAFVLDEPPPQHIYAVAEDRLAVFTSRSFEVVDADTLEVKSRTAVRLNDEAASSFWYATSPNGKVGAIMQLDGTVDIYDLDTAQIVTTVIVPQPSTEIASDIALNEDGSELVVISRGELRRVALADAKIVTPGRTLPQTTESIRFSEDASRVAAVQATGEIVVVNTLGDAPPVTITIAPTPSITSTVTTVATVDRFSLSPTGLKLAASVADGLQVWDLSDDEPRLQQSFTDLGAAVETVFDRSGRYIAILAGPAVLLYDLRNQEGKAQYRLAGNLPVWTANFDPRGERIFIAGSGELASFDIAANRPLASVTRPPVTRGTFSADGRALFTWSTVYRSNDVAVLDVSTGEVRTRLSHAAPVAWVIPDATNRHVATLTFDRDIHVWRVRDGERLTTLTTPATDTVRTVLCFAPDGRGLVYLEDRRVIVYDVVADRQLRAFELPLAPRFIGGCNNAEAVFAVAGEREIRTFDLQGRTVVTIAGSGDLEDVGALYLSKDGRKLAALSQTRLTVWEVDSGQALHTVRLRRDPISGGFNPRGDKFAVNFGDDVDVLDIASGELISLDLPRGSSVTTLFPADSRLIVTAAMLPTPETAGQPFGQRRFVSGELAIWNAATGEPVRRIETDEPIYAASISDDGASIVTSTAANAMTVWRVE